MGKKHLLPLLALLLSSALALSCDHSSSTQQVQPLAQTAGRPLPVTLDGAVPAVPDPVEVYVVKADGGEPKLVTATLGVPMWTWSPDDEHAALLTDITDHSATLRVISLKDGTELASAEVGSYPEATTWSPSGNWLVWKGWTEKSGGTLEAMRADGSDRQELTKTSGYGTGSTSVIGWTNDDKLLVLRWEQGSDSQLLEFDPTSGGKREIARVPGSAQAAGLSKDASRAAFLVGAGDIGCNQAPAAGLSVVDIASGSVRQVLPGTCGLYNAAWSPDGTELAYGVTSRDDAKGTYLLDVASGATRKIGGSPTLFDMVQGWSADGSAILVSRGNCPGWGSCAPSWPQLVVIPVDGGSEEVLVPVNGESDDGFMYGVQYALSSDGAAVAFDQDGLQLEQLPNGPSQQAMAADSDWRFNLLGWSPDGQSFSVARSHSRGYRQFEVNADGSGLKRLADLTEWNDWPAWGEGEVTSPDGSKAAVLGERLQIKKVQSGEQTPVGGLRGGQASWAPDGKTLVFATCPDNEKDASAIYAVDADGSDLKQLTDGSARDCYPAFSPDGQTLAFVRVRDNVEELVALSVSSLEEKTLFTTNVGISPANDWPAWSPDGSKIALNVESGGIYVVNADGQGEQQVAVAGQWFGGQYVGVRWQSNSRIYFVSMQ